MGDNQDVATLFKETIQAQVTRLEEYEVDAIVHHLMNTVGVDSIEMTTWIREADFADFVRPVESRLLKASFEALKTRNDRQPDQGRQPEEQQGEEQLGGQQQPPRPPPTAAGNSTSSDLNFVIDWQDIYNISTKLKSRLQKGKKLRKIHRTALVGRLVTQVRNRVPHASRQTFVKVMEVMKRKYPATFRHELAKGVVGKTSITSSMQAKFDNDRRAPRRTAVESESPNIKAAYGCVKWRLTRLPEGETVETQEEKRLELARIYTEMRPEAWNWRNINDLLNETYGTLRKEINRQAETIDKLKKAEIRRKRRKEENNVQNEEREAGDFTTATIRERWPFLFTTEGMLNHFNFLTSIELATNIDNYLTTEIDTVIAFLVEKKGKKNKSVKKRMKAAIRDNADPNSCKLAALVLMAANFFKEDKDSLIKLIEKTSQEQDVRAALGGTIPSTPLLAVAGERVFLPENIFLCLDGSVLGAASSLRDGILLLFASYFVFNLEYAPRAQVTLEFLQRCVVGMNPDKGNKRPSKAVTVTANGRYSSTVQHQALSAMSLSIEEYLAERGSDSAQTTDEDDI